MDGRRVVRKVGYFVLVGCALGCGADADSGSGPGVESACGEVAVHTLDVEVAVVDAAGAPAVDVPVALEERAWSPGVRGAGVTDAAGAARFGATDVVAVEDCWGTAVDYVLVLGGADSPRVEDPVNPEVRRAIADGAGVLRLTDPPRVHAGR